MVRRGALHLIVGLLLAAVAAGQDLDDLLNDLDDLVPVDSGEVAEDEDELFDDGLDELLGGFADEAPAPGAAPEERDILRDWKGFLEVRPRVYFADRDQGKKDQELRVESELELDFQFTDSLTGFFRPRVYVDLLDGDLQRFDPFEAYLTLEGDAWDVRAGQFVENWGIVDTYNPIDVINRRDFGTDFLDPDRLGELGVRGRFALPGGDTIGEPTISLYALPVFQRTRFAPEDQRFSFDTPTTAFDEDSGFEPSGSERPFWALRGRATLDTTPFNADVDVVAARGPERFPTVTPIPGGDLAPAYFGANTFGFGLRAVPNESALGEFLSKFVVKAEVVYKDHFSFDGSPVAAPENYVAYVLGLDRSFPGVFSDQDDLTLTLEYAGETGANDAQSVFRPFRNDLIGRVYWQAMDFARTSFELRGIFDLEQDERVVEAIFERQLRSLHEDLKLFVQLQYFDAASPGSSVFGFFPDNSSLAVGLRFDL